MITNLKIKNYTLIDDLQVDLSKGLSIITGETGAGKSILLGALGLLIGKRADLSSIRNKDSKCIIEGEFFIKDYKLKTFFKKIDIDYEDNTIIRREILPSGKSRAFINDSPVSVSNLQELGSNLIDIHSQHQTLNLTQLEFQFSVIDSFSKNDNPIKNYQDELKSYNLLSDELSKLKTLKQEEQDTFDYNSFLLEELNELNLSNLNQTELEDEIKELNNVEELQLNLSQANSIISDDEVGLQNLLISLKNNLSTVSSISNKYSSIWERINSVSLEVEDVFSDIEREQENLEHNPERLEEVNSILQKLYNSYQKHQVQSIDELIGIQTDLDSKVSNLLTIDAQIDRVQREVNNQQKKVDDLAFNISENRQKNIPELIKQLEKILHNLGIENASFKIDVNPSDNYFGNGKDELSFLFSANKGGNYNELKKAASGGELSRIMLAIKTIISKYKKLPTLIFDEIDTGVSGEISNKMGILMQFLSKKLQVIAITHLPQIAAKGNTHLKVYKEEVNAKTQSNLVILNEKERINELAEMLSGKNYSETAINHAKELLNSK